MSHEICFSIWASGLASSHMSPMYSKPFLAQAADPAVLRYCDCRNLQFPAMPAVLRSCGPCWLQFLQSLQLIRSGSLGHTRSSNRKVSDAGIIPKHELCERERERDRERASIQLSVPTIYCSRISRVSLLISPNLNSPGPVKLLFGRVSAKKPLPD